MATEEIKDLEAEKARLEEIVALEAEKATLERGIQSEGPAIDIESALQPAPMEDFKQEAAPIVLPAAEIGLLTLGGMGGARAATSLLPETIQSGKTLAPQLIRAATSTAGDVAGTIGTEQAINFASGQPIDPTENLAAYSATSALFNMLPPLARAAGRKMLSTGERLVAQSARAKQLKDWIGTLNIKEGASDLSARAAIRANERNLLPKAFGMGEEAFDRSLQVPGEVDRSLAASVDRLDARGVFSRENASKAKSIQDKIMDETIPSAVDAPLRVPRARARAESLKDEIAPFSPLPNNKPEDFLQRRLNSTDYNEIEAAMLNERRRLMGSSMGNAKRMELEDVSVSGEVGDLVKKLSADKDTAVNTGDYLDSIKDAVSKSLRGTEAAKDQNTIRNALNREIDTIYKLKLGDDFAQYQAQSEVIEQAIKNFKKGGGDVFSASYEDVIARLGKKKAKDFYRAVNDVERFDSSVLNSKLTFEDLYRKRISLDSKATFPLGGDEDQAGAVVQMYRDMGDIVRNRLDDIARTKGALGADFLVKKQQLSDVLAVSPYTSAMGRVHRLGPDSSMQGMLSLSMKSGVARALGKEISGERAALIRVNVGRAIRQGSGLGITDALKATEDAKITLAGVSLPFGKALSKAGEAAEKVISPVVERLSGKVTNSLDVIQDNIKQLESSGVSKASAARTTSSLIKEGIFNAGVLSLLEANGITNFTEDTVKQLSADPQVQAMVEQVEMQAEELVKPLEGALLTGDPYKIAMTFSQVKKAAPDPTVFPKTKSGLVGEVRVLGEDILPDIEDRKVYADMLRDKFKKGGLSMEDAAKAFDELNSRGVVTIKTNWTS